MHQLIYVDRVTYVDFDVWLVKQAKQMPVPVCTANSTKLIADLKTAIATGPSAVSTANAAAASGQIADLPGTLNLVLLKLQEARYLLNAMIVNDIDGSDPILSGLSGVNQILV